MHPPSTMRVSLNQPAAKSKEQANLSPSPSTTLRLHFSYISPALAIALVLAHAHFSHVKIYHTRFWFAISAMLLFALRCEAMLACLLPHLQEINPRDRRCIDVEENAEQWQKSKICKAEIWASKSNEYAK